MDVEHLYERRDGCLRLAKPLLQFISSLAFTKQRPMQFNAMHYAPLG